jgi:DNA-binding LytR/AlgR family response regulator
LAGGQRGFLSQLPASIGLDIICLMAELHYLRVVTSKGQSLVLYNLRDAIAELSPETGIQTHRSYWAAYDHVVKRVTRDGRTFLVMDDGSEVPVSRRRAPAVKKAIGQLA